MSPELFNLAAANTELRKLKIIALGFLAFAAVSFCGLLVAIAVLMGVCA